MAVWGVRIFDASLVPAVKPPYIDFAMDLTVLAYLAAITIGAAVVFGLAPVLQLWKLDVNAALKEGTNAAGQSGRTQFLFGLLVVTEVSLAVILLAGAGLMIRSLLNTYQADIGVDTTNVVHEREPARQEIPARGRSCALLRSAEGTARDTPWH
jgi:hypothetical protein